jgi:hypothetical protein
MNASRRARIHFFADHAGHVTPPGRLLAAKSLADAEEWAQANDLTATWEFDEYADLSWADEDTLAQLENGTYEVLSATVTTGDATFSLSGIMTSFGDPYARVVEAELFSELMDDVVGH